MTGLALAEAAQDLLGSPFRLHGREPACGLDCIGVLAAALSAIGKSCALPNGYSLRSIRIDQAQTIAMSCGFVSADLPIQSGDVVMVRISPCQYHLLVAIGEDRFVHAHAGLRRVVQLPGPVPWPLVGHWRLGNEN